MSRIESPYLTLEEAADYLRCSRRSVERHIARGDFPRYGRGRSVLVKRSEIDRYLTRQSAA